MREFRILYIEVRQIVIQEIFQVCIVFIDFKYFGFVKNKKKKGGGVSQFEVVFLFCLYVNKYRFFCFLDVIFFYLLRFILYLDLIRIKVGVIIRNYKFNFFFFMINKELFFVF